MRKFYILFSALFMLITQAQGQPYETERIIWNGAEYPYRYHHMEQYFNYYPEKRPVVNTDSTIINRNYVAFFEVKENKLFLKDFLIAGRNKTKDHSVLKELHPKNEPMFLTWVSGLFEFGTGLEQFHKNDSLIPCYNNYIVFEVNKGSIGRVENFTHKQLTLFKDYQHQRFKETTEYKRLLRRLLYNGMSELEASSHIYYYILFYSKVNYLKK